MRALLLTILFLALFSNACKKSEDGAAAETPSVTVISGSPGTTGTEETFYSFTPTLELEGVTLAIRDKPEWATFDTSTGTLSGYPDQGSYPMRVTGTKDGDSTAIEFTLEITGDPLTQYAWHLRNRGQKTFASNAGTSGQDAKVVDVIRTGITGSGVRIAVSDTGLEISHEDLSGNVYAGGSRNYDTNPVSPYLGDPTNTSSTTGDHGTSVAGIIAAEGWNNKGARGVAPSAEIVGFNFIESDQLQSFRLDQLGNTSIDNFDIYNQSWGFRDDELFPYTSEPYLTAQAQYFNKITTGVNTLRSGKGAIYVRSAGNSAEEAIIDGTDVIVGIPANNDPNNVDPRMIVVGAMNALGQKASYSSTGSCLWVAGLAGEYGDDDPAMITTDQSGCSLGYSRSASTVSSFMKGVLALNSSCNYVHTFNGTSSAAPFVSGVIALMLEANPALKWRDVKHILAATSEKVQPGFLPITRSVDPSGYVSEMAWVTNAAGFHFHNYFGFGRVDAKAAVEMAATYSPMTSTYTDVSQSSGSLSLAIPDNSSVGVTNVIDLDSALTVEAVQIEVNITHNFVEDVAVELTSPSGTKSILWKAINVMNDSNFVGTKMLSNAFYGEPADGQWTIKIVDAIGGQLGTLTGWTLKVYGH